MHSNQHVTTIIKEAGLVSLAWVTAEALDRGSAVHKATQYYDEGNLDESSVCPVKVAPRLEQWKAFLAAMKPEILSIEEQVSSDSLGYCGTLDRRVMINEFEGVLDIKGGGPDRWHGVQLAAYAATFKRPMKRWGLYLTDTNYKLIPYTDRRDWHVFQAAITLRNWRNER